MKIAAGILALAIFNFPISLNYWSGLMALFCQASYILANIHAYRNYPLSLCYCWERSS